MCVDMLSDDLGSDITTGDSGGDDGDSDYSGSDGNGDSKQSKRQCSGEVVVRDVYSRGCNRYCRGSAGHFIIFYDIGCGAVTIAYGSVFILNKCVLCFSFAFPIPFLVPFIILFHLGINGFKKVVGNRILMSGYHLDAAQQNQ